MLVHPMNGVNIYDERCSTKKRRERVAKVDPIKLQKALGGVKSKVAHLGKTVKEVKR
jgi:hypothetical protein